MVTEETTYAIDAEFAYYGPMAFDVQKMIANLLIAYFASFGLGKESQNENENRDNQRKWLLQVISVLCSFFSSRGSIPVNTIFLHEIQISSSKNA